MRWSCVITCLPLEQLHHSGSDFLPCLLSAGTRPMAANVRKSVNLLSTVYVCGNNDLILPSFGEVICSLWGKK